MIKKYSIPYYWRVSFLSAVLISALFFSEAAHSSPQNTAPLSKPDGEQLYTTHCSACHGNNGDGGVGVPLALPDFQYGITNDYLRKTIRLGRPGRIMPAFSTLSEAEINAIIKHIRGWAPGKPFKYSDETIKGDRKHGKQLFLQNCAVCHGTKGEGGKGTGVTFSRPRELPIIAPALSNPGFLASAPDMMIKTVLMNGREGTPMLSFLKQGLSEEDINDVVSYVRSFENNAPQMKDKEIHEPLISYESPYTLQETVDILNRAIIGKNFKIIRQQYIDQGLVKAGSENKQQIVIYFCNFDFLNRALAIDPRVGLFLPCQITVLEKEGKVTVNASNPLFMSPIFNNEKLHTLCAEMKQVYTDIIEEATF